MVAMDFQHDPHCVQGLYNHLAQAVIDPCAVLSEAVLSWGLEIAQQQGR